MQAHLDLNSVNNLCTYVHTYLNNLNFAYRMGGVTTQDLTPNQCYVQSCCNISDVRLCYVQKSTGTAISLNSGQVGCLGNHNNFLFMSFFKVRY